MKNLFFFLFILTLISCRNTGERYTNLQPLSIGILSTDDYNLPPTLAKDSIGLVVNIVRFPNAAERDSALVSGIIDGIVLDFISAAILQQKGMLIEMVMKNDTNYQMIVGIGNGIRAINQLKGRNIAIEKNTITEYITDKVLESVNISPDTGVNKADIKRTSLQLNLLQNGLIDATILPGRYAEIAIENGNYSLLSIEQSDYPIIGTAFSKKSIATKKKEIEVFIEEHKTPKPSQKEITSISDWLKKKKHKL
jgi:hypothetical protein